MATMKKVKKAQNGIDDLRGYLDNYKKKERRGMAKIKGNDESGKYNVKLKSTLNDDGTVSTTKKARRTLKGFLSGAPRISKETTTRQPAKFNTEATSSKEELRKGGKIKKGMHKMPNGSMMKNSAMKAKNGKSFPDLNKDGKLSKADILVGRGVVKAEKGTIVKKYQNSGAPITPTTDSTGFYKKLVKKSANNMADAFSKTESDVSLASNKLRTADKNLKRQALKGKPGYDANGFPIKKNKNGGVTKYQAGGVTKATKKVGPVDPKGAFTKVQKRTLAGAKTSVPSKKKK
jgi:hypothetical protein